MDLRVARYRLAVLFQNLKITSDCLLDSPPGFLESVPFGDDPRERRDGDCVPALLCGLEEGRVDVYCRFDQSPSFRGSFGHIDLESKTIAAEW